MNNMNRFCSRISKKAYIIQQKKPVLNVCPQFLLQRIRNLSIVNIANDLVEDANAHVSLIFDVDRTSDNHGRKMLHIWDTHHLVIVVNILSCS